MRVDINIEYNLKKLTPDAGKYLTNGETYADGPVFMTINADHSAWYEVDELPEPPVEEPEISDSEALQLIIGGVQ